jgi:uncharacterized membrane protein
MAELNPEDNSLAEKSSTPSSISGLPKTINFPPELRQILEQIPEPEREKVGGVIAALIIKQTTSSFRSPIPPPDILQGYNDIIPDGANRILVMTEEQSKHRIAIEKDVINAQMQESSRGQIIGFILGILGLVIATYLGINGHDWLAGTIATTTIISLVTIFVLGKKSQHEDLESKAP